MVRESRSPDGRVTYSDRDCREAVREAAAELGEPLGAVEYTEWATGRDGVPSYPTISDRFSWKDFCESLGISTPTRGKIYSDSDCRETVREAAAELGEPLSSGEYREWATGRDGVPSSRVISDRFGWKEICESLGISAPTRGQVYSDSDCREAVREAAADLGKPLEIAEYTEWAMERDGVPSSYVISDRFGWKEICTSVGAGSGTDQKESEEENKGVTYSESDCREAVQQAAAELGEPLSSGEYREWATGRDGIPSSPTILDRFGWKDFCESLGISTPTRGKIYSDSDCREAVQQAATDLGEPLSSGEYTEWATGRDGVPSYPVISDRFGWQEICESLGIRSGTDEKEFSDEEKIDALRKAAEELGEPINSSDYASWSKGRDSVPTPSNIADPRDHAPFDSWEDALDAAGLEPVQQTRKSWSKEEVDAAIEALAAELGRRPKVMEFREWSTGRRRPSYSLVRMHYDSWSDAVEAALGKTED